jgi:hypothetical protein
MTKKNIKYTKLFTQENINTILEKYNIKYRRLIKLVAKKEEKRKRKKREKNKNKKVVR